MNLCDCIKYRQSHNCENRFFEDIMNAGYLKRVMKRFIIFSLRLTDGVQSCGNGVVGFFLGVDIEMMGWILR